MYKFESIGSSVEPESLPFPIKYRDAFKTYKVTVSLNHQDLEPIISPVINNPSEIRNNSNKIKDYKDRYRNCRIGSFLSICYLDQLGGWHESTLIKKITGWVVSTYNFYDQSVFED